jgi:CRP-like cAMP-binding protein
LDELAGCLGTEAYEEGVPIIRENQFGDRLYLIESGVVGVYTDGPTGEVLLGKLGEGDRFGDVDLLTSTRRRRVSVVALTPVAVLTLAAGPYERLVAAHPALKGELSCAATDFMQHRLEVLMQANVDKFLPGAHEGP